MSHSDKPRTELRIRRPARHGQWSMQLAARLALWLILAHRARFARRLAFCGLVMAGGAFDVCRVLVARE
eukprot:3184317-Prymnesium_polylepis.1